MRLQSEIIRIFDMGYCIYIIYIQVAHLWNFFHIGNILYFQKKILDIFSYSYQLHLNWGDSTISNNIRL